MTIEERMKELCQHTATEMHELIFKVRQVDFESDPHDKEERAHLLQQIQCLRRLYTAMVTAFLEYV